MDQNEILQAIAEGRCDYTLAPLEVGPITLMVFADALKVDGVRVAVTAQTARKAAQLLGCRLTTPLIEDLIFKAAKHTIIPVPFGEPRSAWDTVRRHCHAIECQLPKEHRPEDIVATVGKSWVETKQGGAVNYGWHDGPYARSRAVTAGLKVIQGVGRAHNDQHWDYSQTLRLVSADCKVRDNEIQLDVLLRDPVLGPFVAHDAPWGTLPTGMPMINLSEKLGWRCVRMSRCEMELHNPPTAQDVARYFYDCERGGERMGLVKGNHCAAFASWVALQCLVGDEQLPHRPRASAKEMMADAIKAHAWHERSECLSGDWFPTVGDLAIYDRYDPANPKSQPWHGHVDRVTRVVDRVGGRYQNLGANEVPNWTGRGGFREQWTPFDHPRLLGFIAYPTPAGKPDPEPPKHLLSDEQIAKVESLVAATVDQLETDFWDDWRRSR